jgi:hypothetical protein
MTVLPRSPRTNGGAAMLLGAAMFCGGSYMAYVAYQAGAESTDVRYLIGWCTLLAGLLCLRRGYDRSTD